MDYSQYRELKIGRPESGILEIVMGEEGKLAVATARAHAEMAGVWLDVDRDPETRVAILRGAGKGFSAGGDMAMVEEMTRDFAVRARVWREARDLVYNMLNCSKLIVSAMHGPAVGAGLAAGLMADISIAAKNAQADRRPHAPRRRRGRPRGDHLAASLRHGESEVLPPHLRHDQRRGSRTPGAGVARLRREASCARRRFEVARKLAAGPQTALRWTKYSLNNWLRMAGPAFDASLALEVLGFTGPEVREGLASLREKRSPGFPPEPKDF